MECCTGCGERRGGPTIQSENQESNQDSSSTLVSTTEAILLLQRSVDLLISTIQTPRGAPSSGHVGPKKQGEKEWSRVVADPPGRDTGESGSDENGGGGKGYAHAAQGAPQRREGQNKPVEGKIKKRFSSEAKTLLCFRCGEKGYFASSCRNSLVCFTCGKVGHCQFMAVYDDLSTYKYISYQFLINFLLYS